MNKFSEKLLQALEPIFIHAIAMVFTILCIWCFEIILSKTLGHNAMFFGILPITYVAHIGDIIAIGRFFYKSLTEL